MYEIRYRIYNKFIIYSKIFTTHYDFFLLLLELCNQAYVALVIKPIWLSSKQPTTHYPVQATAESRQT